MTAKNDITGDSIRTKVSTKNGYEAYREGWERIFGNTNNQKNQTNNETNGKNKK